MTEVITYAPRSWANLSLVWCDEGKWLGGSFALRDRESLDDFVAILSDIKVRLRDLIDDVAARTEEKTDAKTE